MVPGCHDFASLRKRWKKEYNRDDDELGMAYLSRAQELTRDALGSSRGPAKMLPRCGSMCLSGKEGHKLFHLICCAELSHKLIPKARRVNMKPHPRKADAIAALPNCIHNTLVKMRMWRIEL